ncbi:hypothetical protein QWZ16_16980 [Vibrio ostreicida]|uniref:Uncharacterized protein n=1 Tax=Vibrio ostreicida TaxID=526588 RepID=A0ABT8BWD4_9VIBR|nr:hypothetical protein [Vibrio ostreicida]MDN3611298.1 hypothetical protein [Vibrio ostreicida]
MSGEQRQSFTTILRSESEDVIHRDQRTTLKYNVRITMSYSLSAFILVD